MTQATLVLYRPRIIQRRAGLEDIAAIAARIYPDGTADLVLVPPDGEMVRQSRVPAFENGMTGHYYRPSAESIRLRECLKSLDDLHQAFETLILPRAQGRPRRERVLAPQILAPPSAKVIDEPPREELPPEEPAESEGAALTETSVIATDFTVESV